MTSSVSWKRWKWTESSETPDRRGRRARAVRVPRLARDRLVELERQHAGFVLGPERELPHRSGRDGDSDWQRSLRPPPHPERDRIRPLHANDQRRTEVPGRLVRPEYQHVVKPDRQRSTARTARRTDNQI